MHRSNTTAILATCLAGALLAMPARAATLTRHSSEAEFLAAIDPTAARVFENFDGFAVGTILVDQVPGVVFSSPNEGLPGFVPIQVVDLPQAVSRPNALGGGFVETETVTQTVVFDFLAPASALSLFLIAQNPTASQVTLQFEFVDGSSETRPAVDPASGNTSNVSFFGVTSDMPFQKVTIVSNDEAGGLFEEFGGVDDLRFVLVDLLSPICSGAPVEVDGVLGIDGTGTDDRAGDTGVDSVTLSPGAINLSLDVDPIFQPGDATASFRVDPADPDFDAQGTVLVTDGAGNSCELCMNIRSVGQGPTDEEVLCCADGIVFFVSNDSQTPPGTAACSSNPFGPDEPPLPFGFEPSPPEDPFPCTVFTIESPISGETEMFLKKDGDFDPRLRLVASVSEDGGLTFPPFEDTTVIVEPILDVFPDPTKLKGKKTWSPVKAACSILAELCNGIDDDGDGLIDEGLPVDDPTVDQDLDGFFLCPEAGLLADCNDQNATINPAAGEVCNGQDDDCDALIDEDNPDGGEACTVDEQLGACAAGSTDCIDGLIVCTQTVFPVTEACDGVDDDCDGSVDEDFAHLGQGCSVGVGACVASGVFECEADGSGTICGAVPGPPTAEICDGIDNDCDGSIDEDFGDLGLACSAGVGACERPGVFVCAADGSGTVCDAIPGDPIGEICDAIDNDCDGSIDEDFTDLGAACSLGEGACAAPGSNVCTADGSGTECDAVPGSPSAELCDAIDNDCDGSVDEEFPELGGACTNGLGPCLAAGQYVCAGDGSAAVCDAVPGQPTDEVCDGIDNDCDGVVDDGDPGGGQGCGITDVGACQFGATQCNSGGLVCVGNVDPVPESCGDGIDNDCDGSADEALAPVATCSLSPSLLNVHSEPTSFQFSLLSLVNACDPESPVPLDGSGITAAYVSRAGDAVLADPATLACPDQTGSFLGERGIVENVSDRKETSNDVNLKFNVEPDGDCRTLDGSRQELFALVADAVNDAVVTVCFKSTIDGVEFECCREATVRNLGNR